MHRYELPFFPDFGFDFDPGADNVAWLQSLWASGQFGKYFPLIHPQLSSFRDMPSRGLADEPGGRAANSRWRSWRDDYLAGLAEAFPASAAVHVSRHEVDLVLRWRDAVPPQHRFWTHD